MKKQMILKDTITITKQEVEHLKDEELASYLFKVLGKKTHSLGLKGYLLDDIKMEELTKDKGLMFEVFYHS